MIARTLKIAAALALLALPARADEVRTLQTEVASVIAAAHEGAPHRDWDAVRVAIRGSCAGTLRRRIAKTRR